MDLKELRNQLDVIDKDLVSLFTRRMGVCAQVAEYKRQNSIPVLDAGREREKLQQVADQLPEELQEYGLSLYSLLFELSHSLQNRMLGVGNALTDEITAAIQNTQPLFPPSAASGNLLSVSVNFPAFEHFIYMRSYNMILCD